MSSVPPHPQATPPSKALDARSPIVAGLVSMLLHGLLYWLLGWSPRTERSLPFQLPVEIEIGLSASEDHELGGNADVEGKRSDVANAQGHAQETQPAKAAPSAREQSKPTRSHVQATDAVTPHIADAGVAAGAGADAATADAAVATLAGSGSADAGPVGPRRGTGGGAGSGYGVGGALLAIRIDVPAVRASALILETEALLGIIPGWQRLVSGTGLVPMQHFRRFTIATPNLHPTRLSLVARLRPGIRGIDMLRERAAQRGALRDLDGLQAGVWTERGNTRRDIVFFDDSAFAIARDQDLPRLLALGRVLASEVTQAAAPQGDAALAGLTQMVDAQALSLTVHHVAAFVPQASDRVPERLLIELREPTQLGVKLHVAGRYPTDDAAERALSAWRQTYADLAQRPEIVYFGLTGAVEHVELSRTADEVHAVTQLTMAQLRYLLGQLRDMLVTLVPERAD